MTAKQNLELVCKIKNIDYSKVQEKLTLVGLVDRENSKFNTFSLGMKQRLAIASALLNDPEILILDEPTNGLDPQGIHQIRDIIRLIASQGTTILLASHLLDEVEKVCSHVLVLQKGKILYTGTVDGMSSNEGYFELQSENNDTLIGVIQAHPAIEKVVADEGKVLVYLKNPLDAADLNKYLFEKNIYLNHLVKRKSSLEDQFLALTKNK
jgi:ABC-2 type transport system ATP-binding protein